MASINVLSCSPDGDLWKCVVSVDGVVEKFYARDDADLDRQVLARAAAKSRPITLGVRTVTAPPRRDPAPPSQDDLDREAFAAKVREYRGLAAAVKAGVGKTTQDDVDAKVAEIKAAYRDEYAPMLVGVF